MWEWVAVVAEKHTSAEIRIHLVKKSDPDVLAHARETFERLGMTLTTHRNAVLIFLGIENRLFAVVGDEAIHEKVSAAFWDEITAILAAHFKNDDFARGIEKAVDKIGEKLKAHFPSGKEDGNELPDEITFSG